MGFGQMDQQEMMKNRKEFNKIYHDRIYVVIKAQ